MSELERTYRDFRRWLRSHPSDIGARVKLGLEFIKFNGPSPSALRALAKDAAELERMKFGHQ